MTLGDQEIKNEAVRRNAVLLAIAEALNIDTERVKLSSNLVDDLGADSLAFLDIVFRIEQTFGIEISRGEMERAARGTMSEEEFAPGGLVSEAGILRLRGVTSRGQPPNQDGPKGPRNFDTFYC